MANRQARPTFADIVQEVRAAPKLQVPLRSDIRAGVLVGADGPVWERVSDDVPADRALELVRRGAAVASDGCGCAGYCGLDWLSAEDLARLAAGGIPRVSHKSFAWSGLSKWITSADERLLLATGDVRWGRRLA